MKKRRRPSWLLKVFNLYNGFLLIYLLLRAIFGGAWWWLAFLNTFALWLFMPLLLLIPLALLLRGRRTAALSLFLALIGFWKFAPLANASPSNALHDLRVLTFNVWVNNGQIDKSVDWILAQNADIVILQEFIDDHNTELPRLLEIYPFHISVEGNVKMLARYPYVESEIVRIEQANDEHDGRLALRAVLDIDGQMLTVYGVHLSVPRQENFHFGLETEQWPLSFILRYNETRRNRQIRNLATRIAQEPYPVVLAGDFNTSHSSTILDELRAVGLVDSFDEVGGDWGMTWPYLGNLRPILRIDYIWASASLRPLRLQRGAYLGSDHLPLVADFAFQDG
jgi:vancomycin resistance protein VanJ